MYLQNSTTRALAFSPSGGLEQVLAGREEADGVRQRGPQRRQQLRNLPRVLHVDARVKDLTPR